MSSTPAVASSTHAVPAPSPLKNPSYPARTHFGERPGLEARLRTCDEKLGTVRRKFALLANHPRRAEYARLVLQLQGARDQLADAACRMPREAAGLYHEDHERLEVAERSFTFILRRWDAVAS